MREGPVGLELERVDNAPLLGPYPAKLAMSLDKKIPIARLFLSFTVSEGQEVKYAVAVPGRMYVNGCENMLKYLKCDDVMKQFFQATSFNIWIREMVEPRTYKSTEDVWDLDMKGKEGRSKGRDGRVKKPEKVDEKKKITVLHYVVMLAPQLFTLPTKIETILRGSSGFQAENMSFAKYWNYVLSKCLDEQTSETVDQNWFVMSDVGLTGFSPSSVPNTAATQDEGKISEVIRPFGGTITLKSKELALFHKTALIVNGLRVAFTEKLDVKVGENVQVDIVPNAKEDGELYVKGFDGKYIATAVYVGEKVVQDSVPPEILKEVGESPNSADYHKLILYELFEDEEGMYSSGVGIISKSRLMTKGQASESMVGEFAKFSSKDLFYAGVNLQGVDLAWFARSGDIMDVKLSMLVVKDGRAQYKVDSGHFSLNRITEMVVPELLFKKEFFRSLEIRDIDFATFEQIITKKLGARQKSVPENCAIGEVVSLERPENHKKINFATVLIKYGKHKGKKIKLNNAKLSLFGIPLAEIDLTYCLNSHENVYVDVSCIDDYPEGMYVAQYCKLISFNDAKPEKVNSFEELSCKDKVDLVYWLQNHHLSYSLFKDAVEDKAPLRHFIPFPKFPSGNTGMVGNVVSLDPSVTGRHGIMCGTIKISSGYEVLEDPKGKGMLDLKGSLVTFNRASLWLYGRKMAKSDISYVLQPNQRITLEVERLTDDDRKKFQKNIPLSNDVKYKASLVWIGPSRPRNDKNDPNKNDTSIFDWLGARGLNMKSFQSLVDGNMPPHEISMLGPNNFALAPSAQSERERESENQKALQELEATLPDVPVLRHGPLVVHMIETCINSPGPNDPRLVNLIDSEKTAQVAFHVSEALKSALDHFRAKTGNMPMMNAMGNMPMMNTMGNRPMMNPMGNMPMMGGPRFMGGGQRPSSLMGPDFGRGGFGGGPNMGGGPQNFKRFPGDERGFGFRTNKRFKK